MVKVFFRTFGASLVLVGLFAGLSACADGTGDDSGATSSILPSAGLTICRDWSTRDDGKVWCDSSESVSAPDLRDLLGLKDKGEAASDLIDLIDESQVRRATAGLREIDAARLSASEIEGLRELSSLRRHPQVPAAIYDDFMRALTALLGLL